MQAREDMSLPAPRHLTGILPQVAALIARYVAGGGQLDKVTLDLLASFHPAYLCSLSPEQLAYVQQDVVW